MKTTKTVERDLVIYKGGHVESDLLKRLQIPCFNIEVVSCPKYDSLRDVFEPVQNCECHGKNPLYIVPCKSATSFCNGY